MPRDMREGSADRSHLPRRGITTASSWGGGRGRSVSGRMSDFTHTELLPLGPDATTYRKLDVEGVSTVEAAGHTFLQVEPSVLTALAAEAMHDIAHYLRPGHLAQLARIL